MSVNQNDHYLSAMSFVQLLAYICMICNLNFGFLSVKKYVLT